MGLGVLDKRGKEHVPGTVVLDDEAAHIENDTTYLKHASGRIFLACHNLIS